LRDERSTGGIKIAKVNVKVFTLPNCPNCPAAKALVEDVAKDYDIDIDYIDLEKDVITGLQYGIASTPSIAINDKVIARGEVPEKAVLIEEIRKAME
jgi:small redox-active disulfide protein 1